MEEAGRREVGLPSPRQRETMAEQAWHTIRGQGSERSWVRNGIMRSPLWFLIVVVVVVSAWHSAPISCVAWNLTRGQGWVPRANPVSSAAGTCGEKERGRVVEQISRIESAARGFCHGVVARGGATMEETRERTGGRRVTPQLGTLWRREFRRDSAKVAVSSLSQASASSLLARKLGEEWWMVRASV